MADFTVDHDFSRLVRMGGDAPRIVREELTTGMKRSVLAVEGDAKRTVPVLTGNLRRSLLGTVQAFGGGVRGIVGTNVPYARIVEEGRGAIVAGPGRVLRFVINGEVFYRKRVGPAKARPYLRPALTKNRAAIVRELGPNTARRVIARLGGGR